MAARYQALGPLNAGEGSRAILGLELHDEGAAKPVVLVWVPDEAITDPVTLRKIRKETQHAAKLEHPNIVHVIGFAQMAEGYARIVEYADAESLRRILGAVGKLPLKYAAKVVADACAGAHYAHLAGNDDGTPLVHGDVRPETILLSYAGVTKVTGYGGLAFAPKEIGGQRVKGRRVHCAPEQLIAGRDEVIVTTDVYLLGLMLYECLTGVVPWVDEGEGFDQAVLTKPLPAPPDGLVPPALLAVIEKACHKKAQHRYATPFLLKEAIEQALPGQIASDAEVATFLGEAFHQSAQLRAQRKATIEAGVTDYKRRRAAQPPAPKAPAVRPPPPDIELMSQTGKTAIPKSVASAGQGAAPAKQSQAKEKPGAKRAPAAARPASAPPVEEPAPRPRTPSRRIDDDEPPQKSGPPVWVWVALVALVATAVGIFVGIQVMTAADDRRPHPVAAFDAGQPSPPIAVPTTPPPPTDPNAPVGVPGTTGAVAVVPGSTGSTGVVAPPQPPPTLLVPVPVIDAGPPAPTSVAVTIDSTPDVDLAIDDSVLGHTPWSGRLSPGRKVFRCSNKDLGLQANRTLFVGSEPINETFVFEKGSIVVAAPEESQVFIDGKWVATAPIRGEIPVWEGSHKVMVKLGHAVWNQHITVMPKQRIHFNVELQQD